jgi:hypothetical protein
MAHYKKILLFLLIFNLIGCGRNKESEEHELEQTKEPSYEKTTETNSAEPKNDTVYATPEDSITAIKHSILREQKYTKKKVDSLTAANGNGTETLPETNPAKPPIKKPKAASFVYIKKILKECETGVTMTQEDLEAKFKIPKEAMKLVQSVTKIGPNELDIKWKSTWLVEKISDAKFKDGKLKVRFEGNKMYTSGGAISIKYEKKLYTDLYLIGRAAYIPTVKGYYWQIGNGK